MINFLYRNNKHCLFLYIAKYKTQFTLDSANWSLIDWNIQLS